MKSNSTAKKGQKSLTSFFTARLKDKLVKETATHERKEVNKSKQGIEEECIDLSPDKPQTLQDQTTRTSPHFQHPAKRLKLDHDYSNDGGNAAEIQEERQGISNSVLGGPHIPERVSKTHERFQRKLVEGVGDRRKQGADSIVPQKHTPLELQVIELKNKHPGILLIFEVGYKFRFFGKDAEIAASTCNIFCYPDRNFMTASIPVPRLHVYIRRLVAAGHKVGIVRQTETAALKAAGDNKYSPFSRTLTALYTRSTLEAGDREDIGAIQGSESAEAVAGSAWASEGLSNYLVCLVEQPSLHTSEEAIQLGIVAVETSTGTIMYDEFRDGQLRGDLEAHLMFCPPSDLLVAEPVSTTTRRLLGSFSQAVQGLKAEFVDGEKCSVETAEATIQAFYASGDGTEQRMEALDKLPPLVLQALAHALDYLKQFQLEAIVQQKCAFKPFSEANELTLSPNALQQLEILRNTEDGGEKGSLLWLVNHTKTAMGSRLMRSWVTHPLKKVDMINERLDAVEELAGDTGEKGGPLERLRSCLAGLPDLERGITRILHCTASPSEFTQMIKAFSSLATDLDVKVADGVVQSSYTSALLQRLMSLAASAEAGEVARELLLLVDTNAAEQNDKIGFLKDPERFSEVCARRKAVEDCEGELGDLLPQIAKLLRVPRLEYKSIMNQGDYLIEVDSLRTDIPKGWEKISSTKKLNRFRPPEVRAAIQRLELARERLQGQAEKDYTAFLKSFAAQYTPFRAAVSALAALDVLQSLALVSQNAGYTRPQFVDGSLPAQLKILEGRHPVLDAAMDTPYVTNATTLSNAEGCYGTQIITGPNMGGKSSYIRQVALIVILAQMGSFVPAEEVTLRVITAIFTRMGASDNLAQGRSTFLEELSETSSILAMSDESSLVVIDELGRGTSTHDGVAIAYATLSYIMQRLRPLSLFVTHYPQVAQVMQDHPGRVHASYMSYVQDVEPEGSVKQPKLTFLYKLVPGVADRSFGLNVARMAHLPHAVIQRAAEKAAEMEEQVSARRGNDQGNAWESLQMLITCIKQAATPEDAAGKIMQLKLQCPTNASQFVIQKSI